MRRWIQKYKNHYWSAALLSLLAHVTALGVPFVVLPMPPLWLTGSERKPVVFFELVEQPIYERVTTPSKTPLIDQANQRAKDKIIKLRGPGFPMLEGTGHVKTPPGEVSQGEQTSRRPEPEKPDSTQYIQDLEQATQTKEKLAIQSSLRERIFRNMAPPEVEEIGAASFATQENLMVPYLKRMKQKIFDNWYSLVGGQVTEFIGSRVTVAFKVYPDGSVSDVAVRIQEGNNLYRDFCVTAVKKAAPFEPLPIEIPKFLKQQCLPVQFTFYYD